MPRNNPHPNFLVGWHFPTTSDAQNAARRDELEGALANTDLRGEDYVSPSPGRGDESHDDETSPTRGEALERLGIDLGRVGAMTTARINSRQSLVPPVEEGRRIDRSPRARQEEERENNKPDGLQHKENRSRKRNRGGAFAAAGKGKESAAAKEQQEHLTEKLRELNVLLSNEPWNPPVISCVSSKQGFSVGREKIMPEYLVPRGSIVGPIGGCAASTTVVHDDEDTDNKSRQELSPKQKCPTPERNEPGDDVPRIRAQGLGTMDVAAVEAQESQGTCVDVERASHKNVQTRAPVVPRLNIDCRSSTETLPPKEDSTRKPDAKGLPNHRQVCCLWAYRQAISQPVRDKIVHCLITTCFTSVYISVCFFIVFPGLFFHSRVVVLDSIQIARTRLRRRVNFRTTKTTTTTQPGALLGLQSAIL